MQTISRQRAWQIKKQKEGICIKCGKEPLITKNNCEKCRIKFTRYLVKRYRTDPQFRKRALAANQKRKNKLRKDGLCIVCGKKPLWRKGAAMCRTCLNKYNLYRRKT